MPFLDRHGNKRDGPAAVCDACYRYGWHIQIGKVCHFCGVGVFWSPWWFDFYPCPTCLDKYIGCADCHGKGVFAVPRQDVTQEQVEKELEIMDAVNNRPPRPVFQPEPQRGYQWPTKSRSRKSRR